MAKTESSAVENLIQLSQQKPLELDELDGIFEGSAKAKAKGSRAPLPPPRRSGPVAVASAALHPNATPQPLPRTRAPAATQRGVTTPAQATPPERLPDPARKARSMPAVLPPRPADDEPSWLQAFTDYHASEQQKKRRSANTPLALAGAFALGVAIAGVYLVATGSLDAYLDGAAAAPAAAPTAPVALAAPAVTPSAAEPAPAPAAEPAAAAAPVAPAAIAVSFVSTPPGASVLLVDNGNTTPIGRTPMTMALAPGQRHEVLFTLEGRATVLAHVDPAEQTQVAVELPGGPSDEAAAAPEPATEAVAKAPERPTAKKSARPERRVERRREEPKRVATAAPKAGAGKGTLMLGAKPPCEIVVDGKPTGLMTPQRAMSLPAGTHSITLINRQNKIKKTFQVSVPAGRPVKVVKDFTDLMK